LERTFTSVDLSLLAITAGVLPLISFIGILFFSKKGKGTIPAVAAIALSFVFAIIVFFQVWNKQQVHEQLHWFTIGSWTFEAGVWLNNLSVLMLLLVSGIALLVHIYSIQYMKGDEYLHRYWAYLGLFCFSMMSLVIADSLLLVYMFWELVGVSSYLLIGFWFTREAAVQANKKAFLMNRIGDIGFLIGIMILLSQYHTLDLRLLFSDNGLISRSMVENGLWKTDFSEMPVVWLSITGIALFLGAAAKSAQFPLQTWLPDAMEGPTAVSSLIHAATMVAAGVFLIARIYPVFDPFVLDIIAVIGGFTAFLAATTALVQNDIKKILAFSTISQLGFMMLAMGIGAYGAGIFHLSTHAFFKCLLFLAAGAVIHEMHHLKEKQELDFDPQDIRNMGGLRKYMPITFITMLLASLALMGIPLTSGYLSKDAILIQSFEWAEPRGFIWKLVPYFALLTSWLTVFYISRLMFKVFFGEFRLHSLTRAASLHEAPSAMRIPMIILAVCCLFPLFSGSPLLFENAWIIKGLPVLETMERVNAYHTIIPALVNLVGLILIFSAWKMYAVRPQRLEKKGFLFGFLKNQWYFNQIYQAVFIAPVVSLSGMVYRFDKMIIDGIVNLGGKIGIALSVTADWLDRYIVDGLVNLTGSISKTIGNFTRHFQTGRVQHYLLTMMLLLMAFFVFNYFLS